MNELTLDGKTYVSSRRGAEITGYAKDYVGQLCREGHVEARLVGRNWYVLESSIREHRFGTKEETVDSTPKTGRDMPRTWEPLRYEAEVPAYIPPISAKEPKVEMEEPLKVKSEAKEPVLSDMQSAWQEWFEKKEQESHVAAVPEETEVAVADENIKEEEAIPVRISPIVEEAIEETAEEQYEEGINQAQEEEGVEEVVMTDNEDEQPVRINRGHRKGNAARNLILRSIFIGIAVIAVAVSLIGTGFAEKIGGSSISRIYEINLISGVSAYNK